MINYIRQSWLILALGLVCGVALAGVNSWLDPIIKQNQADARAKAALEVVPGAGSAKPLEALAGMEAFQVFGPDGRPAGWAVTGEANGYGGTVKVMFGLNPQVTQVTGLKILIHNETPGLGSKVTEQGFRRQFAGKPARPLKAAKAPAGETDIQAITGATISSQAVCKAINARLEGLREQLLSASPAEGPGEPSVTPPQEQGGPQEGQR